MKDEWDDGSEGSNEWDEDEMEDQEDLKNKNTNEDKINEALVLKHTDD